MHRSRLSSLIIDCQTDDVDAAAQFWGAALGKSVVPPTPKSGVYRELSMREDEPIVVIQQVSHPSRVHLDIESDDLEAEVKRLEALGAKRVEFRKRWWIMEARPASASASCTRSEDRWKGKAMPGLSVALVPGDWPALRCARFCQGDGKSWPTRSDAWTTTT